MRRFAFRALIGGLAAVLLLAAPGWAGVFGKVVAIGGNASDIVLDEGRQALYIANFTASRIEVMSTTDLTIARSINVPPQPGSIGLSPDGKYLVVGHYDNVAATAGTVALPQTNALTVVNLENNTKQTFAMGNSPLGIAFGADGLALILTRDEFFLFDPATGTFRLLETVGEVLSKTLPVPAGTFPPSITTASVTASGDKLSIHGLTDKIQFVYYVESKFLDAFGYVASPPLGPRVMSVNKDGSLAVGGWAVNDYRRNVTYDFRNPGGLLSLGTHVIDSAAGVIYAQVPPAAPAPPPPASATACLPDGRCVTVTNAPSTTPAAVTAAASISIVDADNLAVREQLRLRENLGGRSVLNAAGTVMYSISDSGVTVFPVGSALRTAPRVAASKEDVVFQINACDRKVQSQEITITDPGGGRTQFAMAALAAGISISPSSGVTPARVRISFDPLVFQTQKGTATIPVYLTTAEGVNVIPDVTPATSGINVAQIIRVLVNNHDGDQRGAVVGAPGTLVDILPDPSHGRYYVLRQDKNLVLVFDAATNAQTGTLRTSNTPTQMAITRDGKYLLVGHDSAQFLSVFDLDTLQADQPVIMPFGHYPRSVAVSGRAILVASRVAGPRHLISRVDMGTRQATALATLGSFENNINVDTALVASANGSSILAAEADGTTLLYSANADTFTVARKDLTALSGAYAASNLDQFVIGNNLFNASLVPVGQLGLTTEITSGFTFVDQIGIRTSTLSAGGAGLIQKIDLGNSSVRLPPTRMVESPPILTAVATSTTTSVINAPISVFSRTLAPIPGQGTIVSISQSGITVLPSAYDAAVPSPRLTGVLSAADRSTSVAAGGLVTVTGTDLSMVSVTTRVLPLSTALAESCLTVNGVTVPLVLVSPTVINAQLPFNLAGKSQVVLRTPGGLSNNYNFNILATAPTVFRRTSVEGASGVASMLRAENNELVSDSNPIRRGDTLTIFATGLGRTSPAIEEGTAAPYDPLAVANVVPDVTLDGVPLTLDYAGLTPGEAGVYQINVRVPGGVRQGSGVPLTIRQGDMATTIGVEVTE